MSKELRGCPSGCSTNRTKFVYCSKTSLRGSKPAGCLEKDLVSKQEGFVVTSKTAAPQLLLPLHDARGSPLQSQEAALGPSAQTIVVQHKARHLGRCFRSTGGTQNPVEKPMKNPRFWMETAPMSYGKIQSFWRENTWFGGNLIFALDIQLRLKRYELG